MTLTTAEQTASRLSQMYITTEAILHDDAFYKSLTDNERSALCSINDARKGISRSVASSAEEMFARTIEPKWNAYMLSGRNPFAVKVRNEKCPACDWFSTGHSPKCPRMTAVLIADLETILVPQIGWADHEIFEVNYPDKIQILIDRTEQGEVQLRVWKIGDDNALATIDVELPEKSDCRGCGDRVGSDFLLADGWCAECLDAKKNKPPRPSIAEPITNMHASHIFNAGEIKEMLRFIDGFKAGSRGYGNGTAFQSDDDQWTECSLSTGIVADLHFAINDDPDSVSYNQLQVFAYETKEDDAGNRRTITDDCVRLV